MVPFNILQVGFHRIYFWIHPASSFSFYSFIFRLSSVVPSSLLDQASFLQASLHLELLVLLMLLLAEPDLVV